MSLGDWIDTAVVYAIYLFFAFLVVACVISKARELTDGLREKRTKRSRLRNPAVQLNTNTNRYGHWGWTVQLWDGRKMHHMNLPSYHYQKGIDRKHDREADALAEARRYIAELGYAGAPEVCFLNRFRSA